MSFDHVSIPEADLDGVNIKLPDGFQILLMKSLPSDGKWYWKLISEHYPHMKETGIFDSWSTMQETLRATLSDTWEKRYLWQLRIHTEYYEEDSIDSEKVMSYLEKIKRDLDSKLRSNDNYKIQKQQVTKILYAPLESAHTNMFLYQRYFNDTEFWDSYSQYRSRRDLIKVTNNYEIDDSYKLELQDAMITSFKIILLHGVYSCVESIFRAIYRTIEGNKNSFHDIRKKLLEVSELDKDGRRDILNLANHTRNTFHNNGIFLPDNKITPPNKYRGIDIKFIKGEPIQFVSVYFILDIVSDLVNICVEILNSNKIDLNEVKLPEKGK